jgi:hypothetical protein
MVSSKEVGSAEFFLSAMRIKSVLSSGGCQDKRPEIREKEDLGG